MRHGAHCQLPAGHAFCLLPSAHGRRSNVIRVLMIGLPNTGKSTFLAALWHVVQQEDVPGSLVLERFPDGNREYIAALHARWLRCEPVDRTPAPLQRPL